MNTISSFKSLIEDALESVKDQMPSQIIYWDGSAKQFGKTPSKVKIRIKNASVLKDLMDDLSLGFGENYTNGNIDIEGNLQDVLSIENYIKSAVIKVPVKTKLAIVANRLLTANSKAGAKKNISHHYDLGNDFYTAPTCQDYFFIIHLPIPSLTHSYIVSILFFLHATVPTFA